MNCICIPLLSLPSSECMQGITREIMLADGCSVLYNSDRVWFHSFHTVCLTKNDVHSIKHELQQAFWYSKLYIFQLFSRDSIKAYCANQTNIRVHCSHKNKAIIFISRFRLRIQIRAQSTTNSSAALSALLGFSKQLSALWHCRCLFHTKAIYLIWYNRFHTVCLDWSVYRQWWIRQYNQFHRHASQLIVWVIKGGFMSYCSFLWSWIYSACYEVHVQYVTVHGIWLECFYCMKTFVTALKVHTVCFLLSSSWYNQLSFKCDCCTIVL